MENDVHFLEAEEQNGIGVQIRNAEELLENDAEELRFADGGRGNTV